MLEQKDFIEASVDYSFLRDLIKEIHESFNEQHNTLTLLESNTQNYAKIEDLDSIKSHLESSAQNLADQFSGLISENNDFRSSINTQIQDLFSQLEIIQLSFNDSSQITVNTKDQSSISEPPSYYKSIRDEFDKLSKRVEDLFNHYSNRSREENESFENRTVEKDLLEKDSGEQDSFKKDSLEKDLHDLKSKFDLLNEVFETNENKVQFSIDLVQNENRNLLEEIQELRNRIDSISKQDGNDLNSKSDLLNEVFESNENKFQFAIDLVQNEKIYLKKYKN